MGKKIHLSTVLDETFSGMRLDRALALKFPDYSRSRLQQWIQQGFITINENPASQRHKVLGGEKIIIEAELEIHDENTPEPMSLEIVFEDSSLLIINKPAGLIVHPGSGNKEGTLLNGLLHYDPDLELLPRAGIVHRLDKDTTGLMIVARTLESHNWLVTSMQNREIHREYLALVRGILTAGSTINAPIGRHPRQRTRMTVTTAGKEAITHFRVLEKFADLTLIRCQLETGRTHQIRVHMAHIKHPIIGDPVYAGRSFIPRSYSEKVQYAVRDFPRQALHATRLSLLHPCSNQELSFEAALPSDFESLMTQIRND